MAVEGAANTKTPRFIGRETGDQGDVICKPQSPDSRFKILQCMAAYPQ